MLVYLQTDLFASPPDPGQHGQHRRRHGKEIAKSFKERYPEMFREYKQHALARGRQKQDWGFQLVLCSNQNRRISTDRIHSAAVCFEIV